MWKIAVSMAAATAAARGPGILTKVGLRSFVDPRQVWRQAQRDHDGEDLVELTEIEGRDLASLQDGSRLTWR